MPHYVILPHIESEGGGSVETPLSRIIGFIV